MHELLVRPFAQQIEFETMLDYFINASNELLFAMRIDRTKLPEREAWLQRILKDQKNPDDKKARYYLAWIVDNRHVGHCSINDIKIDESAIIHLHLYDPNLRRDGVGTKLFKTSVNYYFERFRFKKIICEPFSENPAPNRVLTKLGFKLVRKYKTVPTPISYEQEVHRYEIDRKIT